MKEIKEQLDELIKESILAQNSTRTEVLRAIKTEFMKWETAKNAKPLDEQAVIRKMIASRRESAKMYADADRLELCKKELDEMEILDQFKNEDVDEHVVQEMIRSSINHGEESLGKIMSLVKYHFPNADMKKASEYAKQALL